MFTGSGVDLDLNVFQKRNRSGTGFEYFLLLLYLFELCEAHKNKSIKNICLKLQQTANTEIAQGSWVI